MKRLVLMMLIAASTASAQSPSDFRSSAPVSPAPGDALQRLTLPFHAYRDTRPDLADIRIFNAKGEVMPMAYAGTPEPQLAPAQTFALPTFALYDTRQEIRPEMLDVNIRSTRAGTIVSIQGKRPAVVTSPPRPAAWILDARELKKPVGQLIVDWNSGPGTEVARINVEASEDLKSWRPVASYAPVLRIEQDGRRLEQNRVDLRNAEAKYYRLTASSKAFELRSAIAEAAPEKQAIARQAHAATGTLGAKPGDYVYDLGARLPVEALRLRFDEPNTVAAVSILARDSEAVEGRRVASGTFYRLVREGVELESPVVEIGGQPARYWTVRLDPGSPPPSKPPRLELLWRPAQVVFVARGDGPFTLTFGNREAKPVVMQANQLIPGYQRLDELKLREAKLGAVASTPPRDEWLRKIVGDTPPKKIALWAVLVVAVIALGFMAWRLMGQLGKDATPKES